jgi:hypothetical protein
MTDPLITEKIICTGSKYVWRDLTGHDLKDLQVWRESHVDDRYHFRSTMCDDIVTTNMTWHELSLNWDEFSKRIIKPVLKVMADRHGLNPDVQYAGALVGASLD